MFGFYPSKKSVKISSAAREGVVSPFATADS